MYPSGFTALYDACVLYPAPLRDFLVQLALTDLFRAKWTDQIHEEWIRNVLKNRQDLTKINGIQAPSCKGSFNRVKLIAGEVFHVK